MSSDICTNLYVEVAKILLNYEINELETYKDIFKLLPWLRQSLTCCVCSKVLTSPMSSTESNCQHYVCEGCIGGKMVLKPACSWCKDRSVFVRNDHVECIILCFAKLCDCIYNSPLLQKIKEFEKRQKEVKMMEATLASNEPSANTSGPSVATKSTKQSKKKKFNVKKREKFHPIVLTVSEVLRDGLAVKHDKLDQVESDVRNVTTIEDIQHG